MTEPTESVCPHCGGELKTEPAEPLPAWIDPAAWGDFKASRKSLKAKMTPRAEALLISKLDKLRAQGHNPTDLLNNATMNGWKSVYPEKAEQKPIGSKRNERIRRELTRTDDQGTGNYLGDVPKLQNS